MRQMNVVISGFDHYEGVEVNPSLDVPRLLAERGVDAAARPGHAVGRDDDLLADVRIDIHAVTLPISFAKAWPTLAETIEATKPDIVIATGFKRGARGIMMERCAVNLMDAAHPDADNAAPRRIPIDEDGPAAYWTRLPLRSILADFARDGIPSSLSSDAGTFVCNSLFYHLLAWAAVQDRVLAGFVSLPMVNGTALDASDGGRDPSRRGLPLGQMVDACRDVVRESVLYHMRPSSGDVLIM